MFACQEVFVDVAAAVTIHQLKHQSQSESQPLTQSGMQRIVYCQFALSYHKGSQKQLWPDKGEQSTNLTRGRRGGGGAGWSE